MIPARRLTAIQRRREDAVDPADRRRAQGCAGMRPALELRAVVDAFTLVLDERSAVTQRATAAEVLVKPVDDVDPVLELAQQPISQRRVNDPAYVAGRRLPRRQLVVGDFQTRLSSVWRPWPSGSDGRRPRPGRAC